MKYLFGLLVFVLALVSLPTEATYAQEEESKSVWFMGFRYDKDDLATSALSGYGYNVGGQIWTFVFADLGRSKAEDITVEVAYLFEGNGFSFGPIGGIAVDIETEGEDKTILVNAAGFIFSKSFGETMGVWSHTKYKTSFQSGDAYGDGLVFGGGMYIKL